MGIGFIVLDNDGNIIHQLSYACLAGINWHEPTSNNIAEYLALLAALKWLRKHGDTSGIVEFCGDSKLVIQQMNREWAIKEGLYKEYAIKAKQILKEWFREDGIDHCFFWIPREENHIADALSKKALTERGVKITDRSK